MGANSALKKYFLPRFRPFSIAARKSDVSGYCSTILRHWWGGNTTPLTNPCLFSLMYRCCIPCNIGDIFDKERGENAYQSHSFHNLIHRQKSSDSGWIWMRHVSPKSIVE